MSEPFQHLDQLVRRHAAGAVLFREGDPGDKMYVIRTGKVSIWKRISDAEITLAVLGPGEFFGEMALLEGLPRSAAATVLEESLLIEVEQAAFEALVRRNGEIAVRLLRRLSGRLREADRQIQALMSRSGEARVLSLVRTLADPANERGERLLPDGLSLASICSRAGLGDDEAQRVAELFSRSGLLVRHGARLQLGPESLLNEFMLYVELQEQYDPLNIKELAELAGVREDEAHEIVRRVLAARLAEAQQGSMMDTYSTYLTLKQRFEYATS